MKALSLALLAVVTASPAAFGAPTDPTAACSRAVYDYAYYRDHPAGRTYGSVFTDDAVIAFGGKTYSGKAAILAELASLADAPAKVVTRHVITDVRVDSELGSGAKGTAYVTLYQGLAGAAGRPIQMSGPMAVGVYAIDFVVTRGQCRIAKSDLELTFLNAPRSAGP